MGERRLALLGDFFDVRLTRRFLEIHPDTPAEGVPLSALGYPPERWKDMATVLARMGEEVGIRFTDRTFTTNSHKALLLAEAASEYGGKELEDLNERLFRAYFTEGRNLGDPAVLRAIARDARLPEELPDRAWRSPVYEERLVEHVRLAGEACISAVPTFLVGGRWIVEGAVPLSTLREVARKVLPPPRAA